MKATNPASPAVGDEAFLLEQARSLDAERSLCLMPAPPEERTLALALLVLNAELARIPELVTQPMAGYIRYQWWRDKLGDAAAGRPMADPLHQAISTGIRAGRVRQEDLDDLIDAREALLEDPQPADLPALEAQVRGTAGRVQAMVARALGGEDEVQLEAAASAGTAFGLVGVVRALAFNAAQHRLFLPRDMMLEHGIRAVMLHGGTMSAGLGRAVATILGAAASAQDAARAPGRPPRMLMPAFLPARLARRQARAIARRNHDPFQAAQLVRPPWLPLDLLWAFWRRQL